MLDWKFGVGKKYQRERSGLSNGGVWKGSYNKIVGGDLGGTVWVHAWMKYDWHDTWAKAIIGGEREKNRGACGLYRPRNGQATQEEKHAGTVCANCTRYVWWDGTQDLLLCIRDLLKATFICFYIDCFSSWGSPVHTIFSRFVLYSTNCDEVKRELENWRKTLENRIRD